MRSNSGWSINRRYCTGTSMAWVARHRSDSSRKRPASNFGMSTTVPPAASVGRKLTRVVLE